MMMRNGPVKAWQRIGYIVLNHIVPHLVRQKSDSADCEGYKEILNLLSFIIFLVDGKQVAHLLNHFGTNIQYS